MSDEQRYIDTLEGENNWLREKIAELESILGMRLEVPVILALTASEAKIVGILSKRDAVTKEQFMQMLYVNGTDAEIKIVDVFVCKARAKLEKFGISIETIWGRGYRMTPANKAKLQEIINVERGVSAADAPVPAPAAPAAGSAAAPRGQSQVSRSSGLVRAGPAGR
jgi:two-component system cell cycle response regulator CtrA